MSRKTMTIVLAVLLGLGVILVALSAPRGGTCPDDVAAREVRIDGKRYLLISGSNIDASSPLSVVRVYQSEFDKAGTVLYVDTVSSVAHLWGPSPVVTRFPVLVELATLPRGNYSVKARVNSGMRTLLSGDVE